MRDNLIIKYFLKKCETTFLYIECSILGHRPWREAVPHDPDLVHNHSTLLENTPLLDLAFAINIWQDFFKPRTVLSRAKNVPNYVSKLPILRTTYGSVQTCLGTRNSETPQSTTVSWT